MTVLQRSQRTAGSRSKERSSILAHRLRLPWSSKPNRSRWFPNLLDPTSILDRFGSPMTRLSFVSWGFWTRASLILLVNFFVIGAIVVRGDPRDVVPTSLSPSNGATNVSTRPTIQVTYASPMNEASLRASFQISPPVPGDLEVSG